MNGKPKTEAIRLLFELERADNPRLYDELASFRHGVCQPTCRVTSSCLL
jgi:hypothetical protein